MKKPRCVYYPKLTCSVRAEIEKENVIPSIIKPNLKNLPDETQVAIKITEALKKTGNFTDPKWINLNMFCGQCQKKRMRDLEYGIKYSDKIISSKSNLKVVKRA